MRVWGIRVRVWGLGFGIVAMKNTMRCKLQYVERLLSVGPLWECGATYFKLLGSVNSFARHQLLTLLILVGEFKV